MNLEYFTGTTIVSKILFSAALVIVSADFFATLFTIIYQRFWYGRVLKPRYDETFTPRCSIIVPCKGASKDLGKNLVGFLELEYGNYEIIFVTESENDPAVPIIKKVISGTPRAKVVAGAGLASTCAQKNHNLLAAYQHISTDSEILVFADSDIKPAPHWLFELIHPLVDKRVTVTSGFRWLHSNKGNVGEMTHSYVNIFIYVLFNFACFFGGVGLWGGSMAIRRKDFEELGVPEKWSSAAVDDMSLSQIVMKKRKKAVVVPTCVTHSDDLISTVNGAVKWFQRQMMYLKLYQKPIWLAVFPAQVMIMIFIFLLPTALILSYTGRYSFTGLGGGAALTFYIGELLTILMYPMLGTMPKFYRFLMFSPFIRFTHVVSYLMTYSTNTITWAGIKYYMNFDGTISRIEHPIPETTE